MNLKTIGLNAAIATTVAYGSVLGIAPAQAISLNGSVTISGQSTFSTVGSTTTIDFLNQTVSGFFGDFSPLNNQAVTVKPLTLVNGFTSSVNSFIDFGTFTKSGTTGNLSFVLNPSTFNTVGLGSVGGVAGKLDGFFQFGGSTVAKGSLLAASFGSAKNSFSQITINTTAVPTPALLPGLLALGAGVIRKRKAQATEKVEADA